MNDIVTSMYKAGIIGTLFFRMLGLWPASVVWFLIFSVGTIACLLDNIAEKSDETEYSAARSTTDNEEICHPNSGPNQHNSDDTSQRVSPKLLNDNRALDGNRPKNGFCLCRNFHISRSGDIHDSKS